MRYLCRLTLAAALLTAVASGAYAQNPNAGSAPPPETTPAVEAAPAPPVAPEAVPEPPVARPENPPAVAPPPAEPAPDVAQPAPAPDLSTVPAPEPPAKPAVKTKKTTRIEKKTEQVAPTQKKEPDPATAAAAAIAASGTTGGNPPPPVDGGPPPAETAASPAPPPPDPLASVATEKVETNTQEQEQIGSLWVALGIILATAVGIYLFMSRRRKAESLSIFDRDVSPTVARSITTTTVRTSRPGPPITHNP